LDQKRISFQDDTFYAKLDRHLNSLETDNQFSLKPVQHMIYSTSPCMYDIVISPASQNVSAKKAATQLIFRVLSTGFVQYFFRRQILVFSFSKVFRISAIRV
jgi:hypothetical protein